MFAPKWTPLLGFIRRMSEMGVKKGGTWRMMRIPDWSQGGQGHPWCNKWCFFTPRRISWKLCVDILIGSVSRRGVKKRGTWRTLRVPDQSLGGHRYSWCYEWWFFTPKEATLNILCWYLNWKCVRKGGIKKRGTWRTLKVPDWSLGQQGYPLCNW